MIILGNPIFSRIFSAKILWKLMLSGFFVWECQVSPWTLGAVLIQCRQHHRQITHISVNMF